MPLTPPERLILPLDFPDIESARRFVDHMRDRVRWYKIGLELFTAAGPDIVRWVWEHGAQVFLDLKFFDIPNTVAGASAAAARLGAAMTNLHLLGGREMVRVAVQRVETECTADGRKKPLLVGVTVLTSFSPESYREAVHGERSLPDEVRRLAVMGRDCGLDGVVCSGAEIELVKEAAGANFITVVPGIRPAQANADDQKRILTPRAAIERGADFLVVGRPITGATDPLAAFEAVVEEIASAH